MRDTSASPIMMARVSSAGGRMEEEPILNNASFAVKPRYPLDAA